MDLIHFRLTEATDPGAMMGLGMVGNKLDSLVTLIS
jgi:hypothetical protein